MRTIGTMTNGGPNQRRTVSVGKVRLKEKSNAPYYVQTDAGARVELVAHARAAGQENMPETSAREFNDVEAAVRREHERRHRDLLEQARNELCALAAEFGRLEEQVPVPRDLEVAVGRSHAAIEHDLASDHALEPLRREEQRCRRQLRAFVLDRQLTRDARYPTSRLWHIGVVAVVLILEAIANMVFFAATSEFGLAGGFLIAVVVSLVNVAGGLIAGFFAFRWRNHPKDRLRRLAALGVGTYIVFVVLSNLLVAHFRDAGAIASGPSLRVDQLLSHPLSLSFSSAVLFFVGLLASAVACRKGYTLDDPAPGYGDVHRSFAEANEALGQHHKDLRRRALGHAEAVPEECRAIVQKAAEVREELGQIPVRAERCVEGYEADRERIERWCHQHLNRYRSENLAVRTTPPPAHFSIYPNFPSQLDASPLLQMKAQLDQVGAKIEALREEARCIAVVQPARVTAAWDRFESFLRDRLSQADAGRGDGASHDPENGSRREEVA